MEIATGGWLIHYISIAESISQFYNAALSNHLSKAHDMRFLYCLFSIGFTVFISFTDNPNHIHESKIQRIEEKNVNIFFPLTAEKKY